MFFFENLVISIKNEVLLLNLFSMRRQHLPKDGLMVIKTINSTIEKNQTLSDKEVFYIQDVTQSTQALSQAVISEFESLLSTINYLKHELIHKIQFSFDGNENLQLNMAGKGITELSKTLFQNTLRSISIVITYKKDIVIASVINRESVY